MCVCVCVYIYIIYIYVYIYIYIYIYAEAALVVQLVRFGPDHFSHNNAKITSICYSYTMDMSGLPNMYT